MNSYDDANVMNRGLSINMPGLMKDVYAWMAIALLITGFTAYNVAQSPFLMSLLLGSRLSMWMLLIATVALVWHLSSSVSRMSLRAATTVFIVYSILNGLTMASVFIVYTMTSIASVFFVTAGTFAVMSVYGTLTKTDLSRMGNFCLMGLFGLILATVVNFFFDNSMLELLISYAGILIFTGLTAYDTQQIRRIAETHDTSATDAGQKIAIIGALSLYLDFINLFLYLLRIAGDRK
jgi:hypothetical protein BACCOPRO_03595